MGQEVRVKVIKIDPVEKKIGLSIKAAEGEPDTDLSAYTETGSRDGSATLGDLMDPSIFRTEGDAEAETAEPVAEAEPAVEGDEKKDTEDA